MVRECACEFRKRSRRPAEGEEPIYRRIQPIARARSPQEVAQAISLNRRNFLRTVTGAAAPGVVFGLTPVQALASPCRFSEQFSAWLWATSQVDAFCAAAINFMDRADAAIRPDHIPVARLGIVVMGQGVAEAHYLLFRKLCPHGVFFSRVKFANGFQDPLEAMETRVAAHERIALGKGPEPRARPGSLAD